MSTGLIASEIRTAILRITSAEKELEAVFGFGSCFRGERFNDIDVLAVACAENTETLYTYYRLSQALAPVADRFGRPMHLTVITSDEFRSRPLRNMSELQLLWRAFE